MLLAKSCQHGQLHYDNTPMQYTANVNGYKNELSSAENFQFFSFFCSKHRLWVHVDPPYEAVLTSTHNMYTPINPDFTT